jgi:acetolactate synthase I/II/III large subunit
MVARMLTVADLVVRKLSDAGVRTLFGMPGGGGNLDLIDAAGRAGLPFVLTSTETAAAFAAMAQAEITGRLGACLTTLGPGVASVTNGVACAYLDRAPLLVFADSHPDCYEHQRFDHAAMLAPITKWSASLTSDSADKITERAIATALASPPGPVHIDCPGDVAARTTHDGATHIVRVARQRKPSIRLELDALLAVSRKPLVIVGLGARQPAAVARVRAFCESRGVPAMVTYKAKGVVPDDHPLFAGVFTNGAIERPLVNDADLLIGVGLDPVELIPRRWEYERPIVNCGPWAVEERHVPFAAQLVNDVPEALSEIDAGLPASRWDAADITRFVAGQRQKVLVDAGGLSAQRVVQVAADRLAGTSRVTVDAGAHMFPATMLWPVGDANQMLISNGLSTMGFALPAAIGAALVDRNRPVVALTGDGGLLMCLAELLTASREGLKLIVVVFSDGSLSLIEIKQQARRFSPAGVALGAISWPALATSLGVTPFRAGDEAELERAVDGALQVTGPSLIEARIDRSNYGATLKAVRG